MREFFRGRPVAPRRLQQQNATDPVWGVAGRFLQRIPLAMAKSVGDTAGCRRGLRVCRRRSPSCSGGLHGSYQLV
ncbi:hypothetical protein HPP92_016572 [Vanilla planifolia]|uniref:Uncharacterized protein n=1 Tax=Vanilla planifolia TaxID=51239 RepID=A0A835QLF8_VANPL|nr:hypothetical protein HPP92_016572 [Vanilla planifolia]